MKTLLTTEDMKNIVANAFKTINEEATIIDSEGEQHNINIADYLNIEWYAWKNRVSQENSENVFNEWTSQIDLSLDKSYGLVEFVSEQAVASNDIDSATDNGMLTILLQTNKLQNFDYFIRVVRNYFLGNPQIVENKYGDKLTTYIKFGLPQYTAEPFMTQVGETVILSVGFSITYLNQVGTYSDYTFKLSLDGTNYSDIIATEINWENTYTTQAVPRANRPDLAGSIANAMSSVNGITFYDFIGGIYDTLNSYFLSQSAVSVNNIPTTRGNVNKIIWLKVVKNNVEYIYKYILTSFRKKIVNNDFVSNVITLRTSGK